MQSSSLGIKRVFLKFAQILMQQYLFSRHMFSFLFFVAQAFVCLHELIKIQSRLKRNDSLSRKHCETLLVGALCWTEDVPAPDVSL